MHVFITRNAFSCRVLNVWNHHVSCDGEEVAVCEHTEQLVQQCGTAVRLGNNFLVRVCFFLSHQRSLSVDLVRIVLNSVDTDWNDATDAPCDTFLKQDDTVRVLSIHSSYVEDAIGQYLSSFVCSLSLLIRCLDVFISFSCAIVLFSGLLSLRPPERLSLYEPCEQQQHQ